MEDLNLHFTGDIHAVGRGQQPARRAARRLHPARQSAQDRRSARGLEARPRHERPRPARDHARPGRAGQRLPARVGLRHHRRLGGDGHPGRVARPAGPAQAPRRHHRRPLLRRRQARDRRGPGGGRRHDRAPEGRAEAQPDPDPRGPALPDARGPVRQHRARQLLAGGRPDRPEARRLRDHRVGLRLGHGHGEVLRHRLPQGRDHVPARWCWWPPCARSSTTAASRTTRASGPDGGSQGGRGGRGQPAPPPRHRQDVRPALRGRGQPPAGRHRR